MRRACVRLAVAFDFPTVEVKEGRARLLVPDVPRRKGPGTRSAWPFYNPTMVVNRDMAAIALARWPIRLDAVLDGLAGTGAWGIRMGCEAGTPGLTFNDVLAASPPLIRENLARNGLEAEVLRTDLRALLAKRAFDFVDIDPFGPPTPYLQAFFQGARTPSGVGITATDTAPLCGTYPNACVRRYDARPLRCPQGAEIGLRILLGYCERTARAHDRSLRPLLTFATEHFFRILALVVAGDVGIEAPLGHITRRDDGAWIQIPQEAPGAVGPLWLGHMSDADFLHRLGPSDWTKPASARLLARLQDEATMPALFETTDELAARLRVPPPRIDRVLEALRSSGFRATRTHFDPKGLKTDAPYEEIARLFRSVRTT